MPFATLPSCVSGFNGLSKNLVRWVLHEVGQMLLHEQRWSAYVAHSQCCTLMTTVAGHGEISGAPESLTYWILHYTLHTLIHEQREPTLKAVPDEDADRAAQFAAHMLLQAARCLAPGQVRAWPLATLREDKSPISVCRCHFSASFPLHAWHSLLGMCCCKQHVAWRGRERWEVENTRYVEQAACPILLGMVSPACG